MGIKVYNVGINGVRMSKGITVAEFKSWIVSTMGGSGADLYHSVIQSHDGGYIAVGYQLSEGQGSYDALITKYDSDLNLIAQKGLGGSGADYYQSVIQSHDGGYIAVGQQNSEGQGSSDALITKYDSDLNLVTQKGLGGSSNDYYHSVIQSHDGGYIAVGRQRSEGQGGYDAFISKYDSDLDLVTQKSLGGSGTDQYQSVIQSHDGGYIAVGYQNSEGQGGYDTLITKYDSDLNLVTQKSLGGSGADYYQSVIQSHDGGYIAVGYQQSDSQGSNDALITKLPGDLTLISDGVLNNHPGLQWTTPNLTATTPNLIETTPSLIVTTLSLTVTTSNLTVTTPSLTTTRSEMQ